MTDQSLQLIENEKPTVVVTQHAVDQFIERSGTKQNKEKIFEKLQKMYQKGFYVKKLNNTVSLLNNQFKEAINIERSGWILVVVDNKLTTCYQAKLSEYQAIKP